MRIAKTYLYSPTNLVTLVSFNSLYIYVKRLKKFSVIKCGTLFTIVVAVIEKKYDMNKLIYLGMQNFRDGNI